MNFFNDEDPFESIVREFFGGGKKVDRSNDFIEGEQDERTIDFVETDKKIFLVFELSGYSEKDIQVNIGKKEIEITASKKNLENVQGYLSRKLQRGIKIQKTLPSYANSKKYKTTFKNGILEVAFEKK